MASKRKRQSTPPNHQQKRLKPTGRARSLSRKTQPPNPATQVVPVHLLQWKSVDIVDSLDDYEGFLGLEEVDDVDVIRHKDTGKTSFKAAAAKLSEPSTSDLGFIPGPLDNSGSDISEDEWEGFSDHGDDPGSQETSNPIELQSTGLGSKPVQRQSSQTAKLDELNDGAFKALEDSVPDDGIDMRAWSGLTLADETITALSKLGFSNPTPIQAAAIPEILAGNNVIGKASTGSGKTLAFGIPILERFLEQSMQSEQHKKSFATALIVSPTRELAHQIGAHLTSLCFGHSFSGPRIATITGGLSIQKQERQLVSADIVIGTPGRLWEVMNSTSSVSSRLKGIDFLIVDEADRLLDDGHFKELGDILSALDKHEDLVADAPVENQFQKRQTLIFSATFQKGLQQKLASKKRPNSNLMSQQESVDHLMSKIKFRETPKFIDVNPVQQMAQGLREGLVECPGTEKVCQSKALVGISNRSTGSVSLRHIDGPPKCSYIGIRQLYFCSPPTRTISANPQPPCSGIAFRNGAKGKVASCRALRIDRICDSRSYRRGGSWSRHSQSPTGRSLSPSSHCRYVRASVRSHSPGGEHWFQYPPVCTGGSGGSAKTCGKSSCAKRPIIKQVLHANGRP
jgi:ATP-dependent RNA helicase DDX24/MAK5